MPELPEVEVVCQGLLPHLRGRTITRIVTGNKKLRLPVPRKKLAAWVREARVVTVRRRAKYCLLALDNGALLIFHLGMTGRLGIFSSDAPKAKHDHSRFLLDDGMELRLNDTRRFGSIQVLAPEEDEQHFFAALGPEPFARSFDARYLVQRASARKQPVKNFLMDNGVVVGIGNIYASEALFAARLSPMRPACQVSDNEWQEVVRQVRAVLKRAIRAGGSTISDFLGSSGKPGYFQLQFQVYGRTGQACRSCGSTVCRETLGGRATFFCPTCQGA